MRRSVIAAGVLAAAGMVPASAPAAAAPPRPAASGHLAPGCYRITLAQNSGNGPYLHWVICNALPKPGKDKRWVLVNDASGSLGNGTVLMGEQVPAGR